jgi:hypothetical protein
MAFTTLIIMLRTTTVDGLRLGKQECTENHDGDHGTASHAMESKEQRWTLWGRQDSMGLLSLLGTINYMSR